VKKAGRSLAKQARDGGAVNAAAFALKLESELNGRERLGRANLHPYRLKVKELRNTLRLAEETDGALLDALREAKDVIGEWHDWEELHAIAREVLEHGAKCGLLHALKRICDEKYDEALHKAAVLKARHLRAADVAAPLS
jgi:CHAD domain-containing protein